MNRIEELIESNVYDSKIYPGIRMILIPNSRLDFSQEFVFRGFTKSGGIKLGEIHHYDPQNKKVEWTNKIGRFDGKYLTVNADNYLKSTEELEKDSKTGVKI